MSLNVPLLKSSFEQAKPLGLKITDKFYEILFTDYPEAKKLFNPERMPQQKQHLLNALVYAVDNLQNTDQLLAALRDMGKRHVKYGVQDAHYDWVGSSLLKTFAFFFKEGWTPELQTEWTKAYTVIASTMKDGAK